jgi:hypothetical protein
MAKAGYGDLEVGAETTSPQAIHPQGTAAIPGITFSADTDTGVYRAGANIVGVAVGGTGQITVTDGVLLPVTTNDIDLGSASVQFKNAWFDGTLEADAITIGGSSVTAGTNAATVTVIDSTDTSAYVALFDSATGSLAAKTDAGVTYNAGTGMLTATGFTGPLTGNASGTAATVTGGTQASITSAANLATVGTITSGTWEGTTIAVDQGGTGITSLGTGVATFMGTPSSANLRSALTDETGTGGAVFASSPTLVTPALGTPSALVATNASGTAASLTAGTVTTNANLTGNVTSSGNSTTLVLNDLTAAAVSVANDSIAIIDADGSNASKKESIADFVSAIAGTNVTASSGQLSVSSATVFTRAPAFFMS